MSAGVAGGMAAFVVEYLENGNYPRGMPYKTDTFTPTAAMVKEIIVTHPKPKPNHNPKPKPKP